MRRFLRHLPDGGGQVFGPHWALKLDGATYLTNPGSNGFRPLGPKNTVWAGWVRIDQEPGGVGGIAQKVMAVGTAPGGVASQDIYGVQYDPGTDTFISYGSSGAGYTTVGATPAFHPVIGTWYLIWAEYAGFSMNIQITGPNGVTHGGSVGFGGTYNNPANAIVSIGGGPTGGSTLYGAVDSWQFWNPTNSGDNPVYFGSPGDIWNNGKALNYSALPGTAPSNTLLQAYLDFNEVSGSGSYADASPHALTFTTNGTGNVRIRGAGY